jgi:radical SAM superfamily enzyme
MEKEYKANPTIFYPFNMDTYITYIVDFVERLNPAFAIERFAGEVPPRYLSVNNWGIIRYDVVLQKIMKEFERRGTRQGVLINND